MKDFAHTTVLASEHGVVRVFWFANLDGLASGTKLPLEQVCDALGVTQLNTADVQQFWNSEHVDLPLGAFLQKAYDVRQEDLVAWKGEILAMDEIEGLIVIIRSSAFLDRPVTLTLDGPLHHVASLREPDASVTFEALPTQSAEASVVDAPAKKKPSDAAMSGRVATIALIVMGLLVWVMIKVAG